MCLGARLTDEIKSQLFCHSALVHFDAARPWLFWWLFVLYFTAVWCTTMQQLHFVTLCDYSALQSAAFSCRTNKTDF
jgi:hypothetical protein